jgi:hypothetical protein
MGYDDWKTSNEDAAYHETCENCEEVFLVHDPKFGDNPDARVFCETFINAHDQVIYIDHVCCSEQCMIELEQSIKEELEGLA